MSRRQNYIRNDICNWIPPSSQTIWPGQCSFCRMNHKLYCYYLEGYRNMLLSKNKQICLMEYLVNQMRYLKNCIQNQLEQCSKPTCKCKSHNSHPIRSKYVASSTKCCCKTCYSNNNKNNVNYSELIDRLNFIKHKLSHMERHHNNYLNNDCDKCGRNKSLFFDNMSMSGMETPLMCSKRARCASCPVEMCFEIPAKCCNPKTRCCMPQQCCCAQTRHPPPQSCCCRCNATAEATHACKKEYETPKEPLIFEVSYTTNKKSRAPVYSSENTNPSSSVFIR